MGAFSIQVPSQQSSNVLSPPSHRFYPPKSPSMFDFDPFNQWINIPADDWPALPPVDEDVGGLKDITSIRDPSDQYINEQPARGSRGLLLGEDPSPILPDSAVFETITEFYNTPYSGSSLLVPPGLSPDSSPASSQASSTPWLRTPQSDVSLTTFNALTPPASDALWDIQETNECGTQCSGTYFVDESWNSLGDPSSQFADILLEDVACTPYEFSEPSLESHVALMNPMPSPSRYLPSPLLTPFPPSTLTSKFSSFLSPPLPSRTFLAPPATMYHRYETLSPLSTLSVFSPSPSPSPAPLPPTLLPIIPPTVPPMSHLRGEEAPDVTESTRSLRAPRRRRRMERIDDDEFEAPPHKVTRRKANDLDDDEWQPAPEGVKRPRTSSSQSARQASASVCPAGRAGLSQSAHEMSSAPHAQADNIPTRCEPCGLTFTRASDYIRHIENSSRHPETSKLYECIYCHNKLCRLDALTRHIRSVHGRRVPVITPGISRRQTRGAPQETSGPMLTRRPPAKRPPKRGDRT